MLDETCLRPEQREAVDWLVDQTEAFVILPVGYGKTLVALTAFEKLRERAKKPLRALVVSTKNICQLTWGQEIETFEHTKHLSYRSAAGRKRSAVLAKPDVLGINFESLEWLYDQVDLDPTLLPDVLIIDESSKMKSPTVSRVRRHCGFRKKGMRGAPSGYVHRFKARWALSATPNPEGYLGLWSQEACISSTRRLGANITTFRANYCIARWNGVATVYDVPEHSERRIEEALAPILITSKQDKYMDLEEPIHSKVVIPWTKKARAQYDELEDNFVLDLKQRIEEKGISLEHLGEGVERILAPNIGVLLAKLRQACSGFLYDATKKVHPLEDSKAKIKALGDLIDRSNESPIVVFTQFIAESEMIREAFPMAQIGLPKDLKAFNRGEIPLLAIHPRSGGHGINLQHGSHIACWYSLPYSYEEWHQANGRLHRTGQKKQVSIVRLIRPNSVDQDVWSKLQGKKNTLARFIDRIREGNL